MRRVKLTLTLLPLLSFLPATLAGCEDQTARPDLAEALTDAHGLLGNGPQADPPKAAARLEASFGARPVVPEAALLLARATFRSEQPERCRVALDAYFEHATADHPEWTAEAWVLRGWIEERAGRPVEAQGHFEQALKVLPAYPFAMQRLGTVLADRGELAAGIGWLEKAIAQRPQLLEAHFALSRAYRRAGRDADADREATIHRLLNDTSDNTANTVTSVTQKYAAYEGLEKLLPQWLDGRLQLTRMQMQLGRKQVALERLRRLVAEHPEYLDAKLLLDLAERAGEPR